MARLMLYLRRGSNGIRNWTGETIQVYAADGNIYDLAPGQGIYWVFKSWDGPRYID